jgi:hypothetical protein
MISQGSSAVEGNGQVKRSAAASWPAAPRDRVWHQSSTKRPIARPLHDFFIRRTRCCQFGAIHEPFHENARFGIGKAARQRIILQNVPQDRSRQHLHLASRPGERTPSAFELQEFAISCGKAGLISVARFADNTNVGTGPGRLIEVM